MSVLILIVINLGWAQGQQDYSDYLFNEADVVLKIKIKKLRPGCIWDLCTEIYYAKYELVTVLKNQIDNDAITDITTNTRCHHGPIELENYPYFSIGMDKYSNKLARNGNFDKYQIYVVYLICSYSLSDTQYLEIPQNEIELTKHSSNICLSANMYLINRGLTPV